MNSIYLGIAIMAGAVATTFAQTTVAVDDRNPATTRAVTRPTTALALICEDRLSDDKPVKGEAAKTVRGGKFTEAGWQATDAKSQILIEIEHAFDVGQRGAIEVDISNFDPAKQYSGEKHQFISLYSAADGSKDGWENATKAWWNIRGGTNYGSGFKILAAPAGVESRHEVRLIRERKWDPAATYTFRVEWDGTSVSVLIDGTSISQNINFGPRTGALKWIFLGTDNTYSGFAGPTYKCVRVYRER